jgi:hypothetical protein
MEAYRQSFSAISVQSYKNAKFNSFFDFLLDDDDNMNMIMEDIANLPTHEHYLG